MKLTFQPLTKETESQAKIIIEQGLTDHWGSYDQQYNPDVINLFAQYGNRCITAWYHKTLVGTGAWYHKNQTTAFICRMSVSSEYRNQKIGSAILKYLESTIQQAGYKQIELETTSTWKTVIAFYLRNNYRINYLKDGDTYFIKSLSLC